MEQMKGWQPTEQGTPQGGSSVRCWPTSTSIHSPKYGREGMADVRYADDSVCSARVKPRPKAVLAYLRTWTQEAGLTLHPVKTRVVDAEQGRL